MEEGNKPEFKVLDFTSFKKDDGDKEFGQFAPEKYNITLPNGRAMRLKVEPCSCGLRAVYVQELRMIDLIPADLPDFLKEGLKDKKKTIEVTDEHMELNWFERLFNLGYKRKIEAFHRRIANIVEDLQEKEDQTKEVVSRL